jgi:GNAT superfamily N-acetyltransferase
MPSDPSVTFRPGGPADALTVGALATQVFLDTYATDGIRPDLAREALNQYSPAAFEKRLADPERLFLLAERQDHLVGFAELARTASRPVETADAGLRLIRLYVQPAFQRNGLGSALLREVEEQCRSLGSGVLWLTSWSGNRFALGFYTAKGYQDVGSTSYVFEERAYENRIFVKHLPAGEA